MIHSSTRRPDTHDIPTFDDSKPPTFRRYQRVTKKALGEMQCPVGETLFIFITKNPYSWAISMAERRSKQKPMKSHVKEFAAEKWYERSTGDSWKTSMDMRKAKLKAGLDTQYLPGVKHFIHVKYEDFVKKGEKSLVDLMGRFDIPMNPSYQGVFTTVRGEKVGKAADGMKRYMDHLGSPFRKYQYYLNEEWLGLYDVDLMDAITGKLDTKLEKRLGYHAPPDGFYETHKRTVLIRELTKGRGIFGTIKQFVFSWTWWIISRLTMIMVVVAPLMLWLAHSAEAKDVVDRGDGVTVDAEEDRKKEIDGLNKRKANMQMPFMNLKGREAPLAEGWFEAVDFETGQPYYFHRVTRDVTWTRPVVSAAAHKKDDDVKVPADEYDEVAFNDALHQVASEKAQDRLPLNASKQERERLTREISGKLRQRYIKRAMDQQRQQEEVQRMQSTRNFNDRVMEDDDRRRQEAIEAERRREEEVRMRNEWEMVQRDRMRGENVISFGEMRRVEEERARQAAELQRMQLEGERRYELEGLGLRRGLEGEIERSEQFDNNAYARAQAEMLM
ncbi:hypothetical protein TrRE_jg3687 [Triparma retinervis]|uniref:WW domain-containing protein n=1 Tax=Triparma retinervis TaxID=2557542 RepID=A0A9W7ALL7_9STRA|nr:hypothetical protein TrRE_jg3687 [Triparma retinervis]